MQVLFIRTLASLIKLHYLSNMQIKINKEFIILTSIRLKTHKISINLIFKKTYQMKYNHKIRCQTKIILFKKIQIQ